MNFSKLGTTKKPYFFIMDLDWSDSWLPLLNIVLWCLDEVGLKWVSTLMHLVEHGCTWCYYVALGYTWLHFDALGGTWLHFVALGFTLFLSVALGCTCLHWVVLDYTWLYLVKLWGTLFHCLNLIVISYTWLHFVVHVSGLNLFGRGCPWLHIFVLCCIVLNFVLLFILTDIPIQSTL